MSPPEAATMASFLQETSVRKFRAERHWVYPGGLQAFAPLPSYRLVQKPINHLGRPGGLSAVRTQFTMFIERHSFAG